MKGFIGGVALLLVGLTATAASAQANLEINPFAGYRLGGSGELALLNQTEDFELDGGFAGGVTADLTFADQFQFEFRSFSTRTDLQKNDSVCGIYVCTSTSMGQTVWQGELRGGVMILF